MIFPTCNYRRANLVFLEVTIVQTFELTRLAHLNFDLSPELVLDATLLQLRLEQHLQRHDVLGTLLPRQVHVPEFACDIS